MLRDISDHKLQFICIFLMAFITMLAYVGVGAEVTGIQTESDNFYNETNLADAWIYSNNLDNNTLDSINSISSTKDTQRELVINTVGNLSNDPTVTLHFLEKHSISQFYTVEGSDFNVEDADGIWLDKRFADAQKLDVGDKISLDFNGTTIEKTIKGLGYSSEYVYETANQGMVSDFKLQGFAYLSYKAFPTDNIDYNVVLVKTNDSADKYQDMINDRIADNFTTYVPREDQSSVLQFSQEIEQHEMFAIMFPILFVIVSILTLITTMTRIVNNQRTQIGTLKSLGFTNRSLIIHYSSFGFVLSLTGCILGSVVGYYTIPYLFFPSMSSFYTLPSWHSGFNMSFVYVSAIVVVLSTLFGYLATRNIIKESPAQALEPKSPKVSKSLLEKTRLWSLFSFSTRWNIRDIKRSKIRSLVTVVGVIGCVVLLVSAFGMNDGMYDIKHWQYGTINNYNTQLLLDDNVTDEQIDSIVKEVNGTQVMTDSIEIKSGSVTKTTNIQVYNKTDLITPTDINMNPTQLPSDGVSITQKTADVLGVGVGDTIQWHLYGNDTWVNSTVDKIYGDPATQGITITPEKLEDYGYNFTPTYVVTSQDVSNDLDGVSGINTISDLESRWDELTESANLMVGVLIVFALMLSFVVLYSLGVLGFTEVERDMATLKVIGFKTSKIRKLFLVQNMWLSLVGFIIGVPVGYYVLRILMDSSGESFYYPIHYTLSTIGLSFVLTILVSLFVNYMLSRSIEKIDMVTSLKKGRE